MSELTVHAPVSIAFSLPGFVHRDVAIILVGAMANWILFGILWVQVYFYYLTANLKDRKDHRKDHRKAHRFLNLVVFLELSVETVQTVAVTHDVFKFFTIGFTDPVVINQVGTAWYSVPLMTGLIACLAQAVYCYRVAAFTKSRYWAALIAMFSMCEFGAAITVAVQTKHATLLTRVLGTEVSLITIGVSTFLPRGYTFRTAPKCGPSLSPAADMGSERAGTPHPELAGVDPTHSPKLKKRDTGLQDTHNIIKRLVRLSIETGSITASLSGISLALVYLPHHPPYYQVAALILAKTYSNSMIALLNSRVKVTANAPAAAAPVWNETEELDHSTRRSSGIEFARVEETGSSSAYTV
ncbi:hypothetical protein HYPSUDRAFT_206058 [Hypholoma sublateritium FD-334 SS-4]|uniref:DUF6534 domain-containing protein n=1 Tax=Hypholoma sublateritium (strain FD-334 SS-4) TaxID=945553 RepID=A0A0D2KSG0_HYPSF|nr:hypothetical protein HYPSUDRAFT_206058 [Hypholoma sublateritium FD-334 SS-4]